jgi:hypothetical protein
MGTTMLTLAKLFALRPSGGVVVVVVGHETMFSDMSSRSRNTKIVLRRTSS